MSESPSGTTRRTVLGTAGVAAGLGLAAPAAAHADGAGVARGKPGETVVEFRGRIKQSGSSGQMFTSNGFLTAVAGVAPADLFAGSSPPGVGTALFTVHACGDLQARVLDQSVHALDIVGELSVHHRSGPGADWFKDSSFTSGPVLARYELTLQDVLAVYAPKMGLPTLTGEMHQTVAGR